MAYRRGGSYGTAGRAITVGGSGDRQDHAAVSVANHLDGEIRDELRAHVEDKVRGFLSGKVRLTEADALLLAKTHFGSAENITQLFRGVHPVESALSLLRRLLLGLFLFHVVSQCMGLVDRVWDFAVAAPIAAKVQSHPDEDSLFVDVAIAHDVFFMLLSIAICVTVFRFWKRVTKERSAHWITRWKLPWIVILGIVTIAVLNGGLIFVYGLFPNDRNLQNMTYLLCKKNNLLYLNVQLVLAIVGATSTTALWIWWCKDVLGTKRSFFIAAFFMTFVSALLSDASTSFKLLTNDLVAAFGYQVWSFSGLHYYFGHLEFLDDQLMPVYFAAAFLGLPAYFIRQHWRQSRLIQS